MMDTTTQLQELHEQAALLCGSEFAELEGARLTAAPADTARAAQLLRLCHEGRTPVSVEGSGSKTGWIEAGPPSLMLSTRRMNAVLEHTWQDMTCTVQAGCTWNTMQDALAQHGQLVALDPLWPETRDSRRRCRRE